MCCHYGYVLGSEGVDGDHVDVFIGPNPNASHAYIVRQVRPDNGAFDEQKVMLGFDNARDAKEMYLRHYDTPKFFGGMKAMPMEEFCRKVMNSLHGSKLIKSLRMTDAERGPLRRAGAFVPGEDCPHCGAELERDPYSGKCNSCSKPWPLEKSFASAGASTGEAPSVDPLIYSRDGLRESIAAAAMLCALKEACCPRDVVAIAAQRRDQAATVATMFYDGLVSDSNLAVIQNAAGISPAMFRVVLARLRDELHNQSAQDSDSLVPLTPLEVEAPAVSEIPL
jgi:hypothetical protein